MDTGRPTDSLIVTKTEPINRDEILYWLSDEILLWLVAKLKEDIERDTKALDEISRVQVIRRDAAADIVTKAPANLVYTGDTPHIGGVV
jgi:hypothetical protein